MSRLRRCIVGGVLATTSVVLTLLVAEAIVRVVAPQPLNLYNFTLLNEKGVVVEASGRWSSGSFYRTDLKPPGLGPMQPNKRLRFGYVDVEVNEHGWRDRSYPQKAAPGTYRLMVVGDSVTFGYGVELSKTYHKRLVSQDIENYTDDKGIIDAFRELDQKDQLLFLDLLIKPNYYLVVAQKKV